MPCDLSVVVLNFNGRQFLDDCLSSLAEQSYPSDLFEVVFVDNGSSDGSVAHVKAGWPDVRVVELPTNLGFAGGINAGVKHAKGVYVALINNDARAHPDWLKHGVAAFDESMDVAMVASKILTLDGKSIDYAGGALSFYGHGFKVGVGELDEGQFDRPGETLFGSGCALFMPRDLFLEVGGLDSDYFAFFEDVDLGWRLWLMGYRVWYEPASVVYHRHHGTADALGRERERFLLERNALITIIKNYEDEAIERALGPAIMLALERGLSYSDDQRQEFDLATADPSNPVGPQTIDAMTMAHLLAISEISRNMPQIMERRREIQARRRRRDIEILPLFREALTPNVNVPRFSQTFDGIVEQAGLNRVFNARTRVLLITGDTVSSKMAGPAIRAWEMCSELSRKHEVRMLVTSVGDVKATTFDLQELSNETLHDHIQWADVIIHQGFVMHANPTIKDYGKVLVADLYDPFHIENLEMFQRDEAAARNHRFITDKDVIAEQLTSCDYFICASEKQRDFWLGQLSGAGRLNPFVYDQDPTLRSLIDVVPFGVSGNPPEKRKKVLKGVVPGIADTDRVLLWGGGIYNWFDPLTLIRAVELIAREHPEIKLFFMGLTHPNPGVPKMRMATEARALAAELGVEGTQVFFNDGWVPYEERADYLLEADIGVSCHFEHIETTYSYRTRVLDYFWAELPVIVTRGDALGQLVEEHRLGLTVAPGDVDGFAAAILQILQDGELDREFRRNIAGLRPDLSWGNIIKPLDDFCTRPRHAADRLQEGRRGERMTPRRRLVRRMEVALEQGGPVLVAKRAAGYAYRKMVK
jgi:GT2 family glycosyltransferase/glycosyltransferase involved in cell wall biosynthesis